jgi:hypothetical protein
MNTSVHSHIGSGRGIFLRGLRIPFNLNRSVWV